MHCIPLAAEIEENLQQLGIPLSHDTIMLQYVNGVGMRTVRGKLIEAEQSSGITPLTNSTFWDITPKYRYDALIWDIGALADGLSLSAALTHLYVHGTVKPYAGVLAPTRCDELFWYYVDTGVRLASSGWDRLALLLDMAFDLGLGNRCSFREAMKKLATPAIGLSDQPHLTALIDFRDHEFIELEGEQRGHGLRHEATHLLNVWTRYKLEYVEQHTRGEVGSIRGPHEWHETVVQHYHHYIRGIEESVGLIESAMR